ncbi:hypothetical protein OROGR_004943 [Orobanche gracilis]
MITSTVGKTLFITTVIFFAVFLALILFSPFPFSQSPLAKPLESRDMEPTEIVRMASVQLVASRASCCLIWPDFESPQNFRDGWNFPVTAGIFPRSLEMKSKTQQLLFSHARCEQPRDRWLSVTADYQDFNSNKLFQSLRPKSFQIHPTLYGVCGLLNSMYFKISFKVHIQYTPLNQPHVLGLSALASNQRQSQEYEYA